MILELFIVCLCVHLCRLQGSVVFVKNVSMLLITAMSVEVEI